MKRIVCIAATLAMGWVVAGCGSEAGGEEASQTKPLTEKQPEVKLETDETVSGAWNEGDKMKAHGAVVLENRGEGPVEIHSVRLDFHDKDQEVLASEEILSVVPKIVKPGEKVHVGATTDLAVDDPENLETVVPSIEAEPAWKPSVHIQAKQVKWKQDDDGGIVEGTVVNRSEEDVTDLFVTTAFRDEEGQLLGVVNDYLDVALAPGEEEAFKSIGGSLPAEWLKDVSEVEVNAYPLFREDP